MINITANGREVILKSTETITDYLARNQYRPERIAVELNGEILPKSNYANTMLKDGDILEVVSFVGGG
ncbi:MAG: sulfur carrier protein ThiS [Clostridiales bacterium]|nr:sulfur carrier protein ThiS [Clostridiales bacterium]